MKNSWEYVDEGRCPRCGDQGARVYEDVIFHVPMLECQQCGEVRRRYEDESDSSAESGIDAESEEQVDSGTPANVAISPAPRSRPSSLAERSLA